MINKNVEYIHVLLKYDRVTMHPHKNHAYVGIEDVVHYAGVNLRAIFFYGFTTTDVNYDTSQVVIKSLAMHNGTVVCLGPSELRASGNARFL